MNNNNTRDMNNYKPYRTKVQKQEARRTAIKCADGTWRSTAPVSYHNTKPVSGQGWSYHKKL